MKSGMRDGPGLQVGGWAASLVSGVKEWNLSDAIGWAGALGLNDCWLCAGAGGLSILGDRS